MQLVAIINGVLVLIYLLTAIGLTPSGSSAVHIRLTPIGSTVQYSSTVQQYSKHLHTNSTQNNTINNFGWKAFWDSNPDGQTKINDELIA